MHRSLALALLAAFCGSALAQAAPRLDEPAPADPRKNQKVERLHTEDSAVAIDEVRYAGQTESITVRPKDGLPEYEIQPSSPARQRLDDSRRGNAGGERVWNLFHF
jgi:hypothetical protein